MAKEELPTGPIGGFPPPTPYGKGLTLDMAKKMLEAGEQAARKMNIPFVIAICDEVGNLLALYRMEGVALFSIEIAQRKAYSAVIGMMPTDYWRPFADPGMPFHGSLLHDRFIYLAGGFPIIIKGQEQIIGGIGVSGATIEDLFVAKAALETVKAHTEAVDATIANLKKILGGE